LSAEWRDWLSRIVALRDTVAGLAPLPTTLWLGGSILLGLIIGVRILRFRRIFAEATDAPPSVRRLAIQAAAAMDLHSVPHIMMVCRRISPLVWCGPRKCLILPDDLWNNLDDVGRRAVLTHELAHLKRRDHWVCWAEMIVGCLYWWHPLVWWIRRRLRDEADFCCDAWVTSLVPAGRRAYAQALLATRQYVNETQHAVPAVGLGATTTHAKRFARRLTMVMTDRPMPRLSMWGCALAICLAAGAWLSTPLWACPPESSGSSGGECTPAPTAKAKPKSSRLTVIAPAQGAAPDVSTFEAYMSGRDPHADQLAAELARLGRDNSRQAEAQAAELLQRSSVEARLNRLEEQLNRLTHQIEALMQGDHRQRPAPGGGAALPGLRMRSPGLLPAPTPAPPARSGAVSAPLTTFGFVSADDGETVARVYRLPKGKREAFTQFMSRSDVPILVAPDSEGIEVHATPRQHEIFGAFIELINPSTAAEDEAPSGQEAPPGVSGLLFSAPDLEATARRYVEAAKTIARHMKPSHARAIAESMNAHQKAAAEHLRHLNQKAQELYRKAATLQQHSSEVGLRADEASDDQARDALRAEADQLAVEAQALQEEGDLLEEQASEMRDQLAELEDAAQEALEESQDEIEAVMPDILQESADGE
ncbi:MAG: hypothetical protein L0219_10760, partial [Phycisphaerales bacterium]|nr:hypothetical protein [Phycisphaerales bacterium]MCI0674497.1 hypothetical protein [Phycisphaerales bacterium]